MPVSDNQVRWLVEDALMLVPNNTSPDVTLHAFQAIEKTPELLRRHKMLNQSDKTLNARIGKTIKEILGRENDTTVRVTPEVCSLISSYTRFKP